MFVFIAKLAGGACAFCEWDTREEAEAFRNWFMSEKPDGDYTDCEIREYDFREVEK